MIRNEETLEVSTYANRLPDDLTGRQVFILDPMLATGGTLVMAIDYLTEQGCAGHHGRLPPRGPRGHQAPRGRALRERHPGQGRARHHRREAQREGLHRPRPRRRRRPPLRRRLSRLLRAYAVGSGQRVAPLGVSRPPVTLPRLLRDDLTARGAVGAARPGTPRSPCASGGGGGFGPTAPRLARVARRPGTRLRPTRTSRPRRTARRP